MGFSTSGAILLLFIAGIIAASVLVPTTFSLLSSTGDAFGSQSDQIRDQKNTDFSITSADNGNGDVTIEAVNDGSETLEIQAKTLLLDGEAISQENISSTIDGDNTETNLWLPGAELTLEIDSNADDSAKLVATNGLSSRASIGGS